MQASTVSKYVRIAIISLLSYLFVVVAPPTNNFIDVAHAVTPGLSCSLGSETSTGSGIYSSAANNLQIEAVHGKAFYFDAGDGIDASYIGYKVTNTSASARTTPVYVTVDSFAAASGSVKVSLANDATSAKEKISSISGSSNETTYFFVKTNATGSKDINIAQTHNVKVYTSDPDASGGATAVLNCTYQFSKIIATLSAAANKVTGLSVDKTSLSIGETFTITQTGTTGIIGNGTGAVPDGNFIWMSPASKSSFPTSKIHLEKVSFTSDKTGAACSSLTNSLIVIIGSTNCDNTNSSYTASYVFKVIGSGVSIPIEPVSNITSGTQVKHSTPASGVSLSIDLRSVSDTFSMKKTLTNADFTTFDATTIETGTITSSGRFATFTPGGAGTHFRVGYKVVVSKTGSSIGTIDEIIDSTTSSVYMQSSSATYSDLSGDTITVTPTFNSDNKFHFSGPFQINSSKSLTLTYKMLIPITAGTYANTVTGKVGTNTISSNSTVSASSSGAALSLLASAENDSYSLTAGETLTADVGFNDTKHAATDTFTVTIAGSGSAGGTLTFNSNGTFTYVPATSGTYSFTYNMCLVDGTDCKTATVTITVAAVPGPNAINDSFSTPYQTQLTGKELKTNDVLPSGSTYTYSKGTPSQGGTVNTFNTSTAEFTYTPANLFYGVDTFTVTVCNAASVCDTSTTTINVGPIATDDSKTTSKDTAVSGSVSGNDSYPTGSTFDATTDPSNGTVTFDTATATYTYTPNSGFTGTDSFTYTVCLPTPNDSICSTATVTITVTDPGSGGGTPPRREPPTTPPTTPPGNNNNPGRFTPTGPGNTNVIVPPPPPGGNTQININGRTVCTTTSGSCAVPALLGPKAKIEAVTTAPDGTKTTVILPAYKPEKPIPALVVYFPLASYKLTKTEIKKLDNFVKLMKEQGFTRVVLEGHTDVQGTTTGYDNVKLSNDRSKIVAAYLSKFLKVKIAKDSFADTKPAVDGSGEQVYKNNRRTEVLVW